MHLVSSPGQSHFQYGNEAEVEPAMMVLIRAHLTFAEKFNSVNTIQNFSCALFEIVN